MSNKISIWTNEQPASTYETGQSVDEFLTQHFGSVEEAIAKGLHVSLNDVEQLFDKFETEAREEEAKSHVNRKPKPKGKPNASKE